MNLGVEHEYRLWSDGTPVDFRRLIGRLCGDLRTLDPGDPRARRLPSGVALTADGWEAELATPPLPVGPGLPGTIDRLLRAERTELRRVAAAEGVDRITGFSTHLNITVPDDEVVSVGQRFAEHCLAALAEVMEPDSSSGMFVRPRRGRLEIGGEYVEGADLEGALTLLVGCVEALRRGRPAPATKPPVLEASREKFGWYAAELPAGQLGTVWSWARADAVARGLDPAPVDDLVAGSRALRRHAEPDPSGCTFDATLPTSGTGTDCTVSGSESCRRGYAPRPSGSPGTTSCGCSRTGTVVGVARSSRSATSRAFWQPSTPGSTTWC